MATESAFLIVNPAAAGGRGAARWREAEAELRRLGVAFDFELTRGPGDAVEMATRAARDGRETVVAVGGDGTVNEVANGLMAVQEEERPCLGVIPTGRGRDFMRTLVGNASIQDACRRLQGYEARTIDLGLAEYRQDGQRRERYFVNIGGFGFEGEVARRATGKGGTVAYLSAILGTLFSYRNKRVELCLDGRSESIVVNGVTVANGCYYAGGMRIAPRAHIDDGLLDAVVMGDVGKFELIANLPQAFRGTHLAHPKVGWRRTAELSVTADEPVYVQLDGDTVGELPATFRVVPSAIQVRV